MTCQLVRSISTTEESTRTRNSGGAPMMTKRPTWVTVPETMMITNHSLSQGVQGMGEMTAPNTASPAPARI